VVGLDLWGEKKGGKIQMYVFDFNYHRRVKKTLYRSPLHNKYMFVYNIERYFMYSIYKKEPKWHNKTPKWHTKNREHVWERYYFLYDFFKERILLVFVHNNLGKTGVLFEKLFSVCICF